MTEPRINQNGTIPISSRKMVRFQANVPIEIALQGTDGVRVEGRYGDRVKYTLTDDRTMYVDPFVAARIQELAIQPGELFQICKRQAKKGNRKTIYWVVGPDQAASQLERDLRASLERVKTPEIAPQPAPVPSSNTSTSGPVLPAPPPIPFYELEPSSPGGRAPNAHAVPNGSGNGSSPARPSTDDVPPRPPDTQLAHALKTAIAAAADAETFAKTLNYSIRFTTEDVRSMGITILIGMQQRTPR
jgi:hypothetical protein